MKVLFALFMISLSQTAQATGRGIPLEWLEEGEQETLLFLSDGQVGRLPAKSGLLPLITGGLKNHRSIWVTLDRHGRVRGFKTEASKVKTEDSLNKPAQPGSTEGTPSILTPDEAQSAFSRMNSSYRNRSQCFNRAHVWTYEALNRDGVHLMKVFMFFTSKYIRDYHYRWWFHVSPFTYVQDGNGISESILDFTFMSGPTSPREWSNYFIKPKTECPTVKSFSDYSSHQYDQYCYFMKVPMYFWQPRHLEALEQGSPHPDHFVPDEVDAAYAQGFRNRP
jgi:hypothetical protein